MKKAPLFPEMARAATLPDVSTVPAQGAASPDASNVWSNGLPLLSGARLSLRELRVDDAHALVSLLSNCEVARCISTPPSTFDGFARFIDWAVRERTQGNFICFAVVPHGMTSPVGLFQVRPLEPGFGTAEWGFVLGSDFWGSGIFVESATMVLDFLFQTIGVRRLEARTSTVNGRGNGALRKLGAVREGILRQGFRRDGELHDQVMWALLAEDWEFRRMAVGTVVH
jgi:[ribosomal protein S5]-alanine N-acetyltransferase